MSPLQSGSWITPRWVALAVGTVVATGLSLVDWVLNPGGIFHDQRGTHWGVVFDTFFSWLLPVTLVVFAVAIAVRYLFVRTTGPGRLGEPPSDRRAAVESLDDFDWMFPPHTVTDPVAWDRYWHDQLTHGVAGFVHLFVDDGPLVDAMRAHGLRTVLCVGNGISQEARALAWAGFEVTALDISPLAAKVASEATPPDEVLARLVGGRPGGQNGRVEFVVGDLCDPGCCPGPFDVVIDRRTLQLWPDEDRPTAVRAVANRLASPGIFFTQSHDGRWKPPAPRRHALQPWFVAEGWKFWRGESSLKGRVAWLSTTTG